VTVEADGRSQLQHVTSASGFSAQNQRRLHFGLGAAKQVDKVTVHWPSGQVQQLAAPAVDQLHRVHEAPGAAPTGAKP
jgi:hypothetical protein